MSDWISVKDRLPAADATVLIADGDIVTTAWWNPSSGCWWTRGAHGQADVEERPTHWMPLPDPPA